MDPSTKLSWSDFLKLERVIPIFTILGAAVFIVLANIGILKVSLPEQVIIGLLGILAIDALIE